MVFETQRGLIDLWYTCVTSWKLIPMYTNQLRMQPSYSAALCAAKMILQYLWSVLIFVGFLNQLQRCSTRCFARSIHINQPVWIAIATDCSSMMLMFFHKLFLNESCFFQWPWSNKPSYPRGFTGPSFQAVSWTGTDVGPHSTWLINFSPPGGWKIVA